MKINKCIVCGSAGEAQKCTASMGYTVRCSELDCIARGFTLTLQAWNSLEKVKEKAYIQGYENGVKEHEWSPERTKGKNAVRELWEEIWEEL